MSKQAKRKLVTPITEKKVSDEKLVKLLKTRQYSLKELKEMGVTEFQILQLKKLNNKVMYQYDPTYNDFVYYIVEKGEDPFIFLPEQEGDKLKIAKMGDIHLGSTEVDEIELISLLSYLWEEGYRVISISGDLVDGYGVYRGHIENLAYTTLDDQANLAVSILSLFDFVYIINKGNHDASSTKNAGVDVLAMIEEKMINRGKKFVYLKSYSGYIIYKDVAIQIIHMDGGNSAQSDTYANQKLMDNLNKTSLKSGKSNGNCVRVFDKMIPVVNVITGHYHTLGKFTYGNVVVESPLTAQHTTDFVNRRGLKSKTGARVSEMTFDGQKCVSEKGSIIFGRDVSEIYGTEGLEAKEVGVPKVSNHLQSSEENEKVDLDKINTATKLLFRKGFFHENEVGGMTKKDISYMRTKCGLNVYKNADKHIVLREQTDSTNVIYSTVEQKGVVRYLEISNMLIGSNFFSEEAFRYMLDEARKRNIRHIHFGGNLIWGIPKKSDAENTKYFSGEQQVNELIRILSDYPEFHYFSINGVCENSFIRATREEIRFNPMLKAETMMAEKGIKFTAVNSNQCDFLIYGIVFRMVNNKKALRTPYTRDYDIVKAQRSLMAKQGNVTKINGRQYNIGTIFYGYVPSTLETHSCGIYATSTAGPTIDPDNLSRVIQSNPECAIVNALVNHGEILRFEREIIAPNY